MASKKRQQTINKRNRERAIEEKRTLKRLRKQEKREAARNGDPTQLDAPVEGAEPIEGADPVEGAAPADGDLQAEPAEAPADTPD
jgi:hypothetical protein